MCNTINNNKGFENTKKVKFQTGPKGTKLKFELILVMEFGSWKLHTKIIKSKLCISYDTILIYIIIISSNTAVVAK